MNRAAVLDWLPPGVHDYTEDQFLERYCAGSDARQGFRQVLPALFDSAENAGAAYALVGGSFVSPKEPRDLDIVIVHRRRETVPGLPPDIDAPLPVDVQYASEDEPAIVAAFHHFLGERRNGDPVGLVRVSFSTRAPLDISGAPRDDEALELIRKMYGNRHTIPAATRKGLLITVHGLFSTAPWNAELSRYASAQGWVVAPFLYGFKTPLLFFNRKEQQHIIDQFRKWLDDVVHETRLPVSVVAHSFGTVLIAKYVLGFDVPPHHFKALVLTGCVLSEDLSFSQLSKGVGKILHEKAPNDRWVRRMRFVRSLSSDSLIGCAGARGFSNREGIEEPTCDGYTHTNVIAPDVIRGRWLPFLNANR